MRDSRAAAFGDAIGPLEAMIEMLRLHGPTTVLQGLESMLDVCRVASTEPGSVDEASQRLAGIRRAISRPMSDLVIVADTGAESSARNERFETLKEQLSSALVRTDPPDRIKQVTPQPSSMTIYERLNAMAVSSRRVTDERALPGTIEHELSPDHWTPIDGSSAECLMKFVRPQTLRRWRRDESSASESIAVAVTRFVFDHGVDVTDLVDHALVGVRSLDSWREESFRRWPIGTRHSGWAQVAGTFHSEGETLFTTATYVVHERGNVGYLVHTTANVRDENLTPDDRAELAAAIMTVHFVD